MATTNINIRVDSALKKQAESLFADLGLNLSSAINVFLKSAVDYDGIPFELRRNAESTVATKAQVRKISAQLIKENQLAYKELAK